MLECQEYLELRQQQCIERMCMKPSQATISDLDFLLWYKEAQQDQEVCDNSSATCPKDVSSRLASNEEIQDFLYKDHLLDEKIKAGTVVSKKTKFDCNRCAGKHKHRATCPTLKPTLKPRWKEWTPTEDVIIIQSISEGMTKWSEIAERILGRTGQQCRDRWFNHLDATIKKGPWDDEEDKLLTEAVKKWGEKNWKAIAGQVPGRTDAQCYDRWENVLRPELHKGRWSKEEDAIVLEVVKRSGGVNSVKWSVVANQVKGRLGKQVSERWYNHLDPTLSKAPWSDEEDAKLLALQQTMGNRWADIAESMKGRSRNNVKNRFNSNAFNAFNGTQKKQRDATRKSTQKKQRDATRKRKIVNKANKKESAQSDSKKKKSKN